MSECDSSKIIFVQKFENSRYESKKSVRDDVSKQVSDVRFASLGVTDVQDAAAKARWNLELQNVILLPFKGYFLFQLIITFYFRARIFELERELEEISRLAMASQNR